MTSSPFASPAPASGGFVVRDHVGSLVLIEVLAFESDITTVNGPTDAIRANVAVLDGDSKGEQFDDTLVWGKVLVSQLRSRIGAKVLGRLGRGNAKSGQSAPWVLEEATEADVAIGTAYLAGGLAKPGTDTPPF